MYIVCALRIILSFTSITLVLTCETVDRIRTDSKLCLTKHGECNGTIGVILEEIRNYMNDIKILNYKSIHAYIVPMNDAHQNEYIADHDKRLQYISDFTGSAGEAIITQEQAIMWTDSRYHIQAEKQLDHYCWTLMKSGSDNVPSMIQWILANLPKNSLVGIDPFLITNKKFIEISEELQKKNITLNEISNNIIDLTWKTQPEKESNAIFPLGLRYSGKVAGEKVAQILNEVKSAGADAIIVTALDDIAWLLNLRGTDIPFNPVFFSYLIISTDICYFLVDINNISEELIKHLSDEKVICVFRDYNQIIDAVMEVVKMLNVKINKVVVSPSVSRAIALQIPEEMRIISNTVAEIKAVKNTIEAKNMIKAHIRDGLSLIQYLHWLNTTIDCENITELSGAEKLTQYRSNQANFFGLSFATISAVGEHSSMVHYIPTEETSKKITRNEIYLIDSGGQYSDGTTDVTRTYHFGTPREEEKICYTSVLKGFISFATSIFPTNTTLKYFDFIARRSLWQEGLNYGHGSGHGVGMFLFVHEYPPSINSKANDFIMENMFTTNEPGYYKEDEFGIRIEDVLQVIKTGKPNAFNGNGGLAFKSITYVPIPTNLIVKNMLTKEEILYVNIHNKRVLETIGPILLSHKLMDTHRWLKEETQEMHL